MRLIDADALDYGFPMTDDVYGLSRQIGIELVKARIAKAPTIEAEPVRRGKWIWKDYHGDGSLILCCSECLETEGARETAKYCCECGAKMDGE